MGVPAFYRWLSEKYPKIVVEMQEDRTVRVEGTEIPLDLTAENPCGIEVCISCIVPRRYSTSVTGLLHTTTMFGPWRPKCARHAYISEPMVASVVPLVRETGVPPLCARLACSAGAVERANDTTAAAALLAVCEYQITAVY